MSDPTGPVVSIGECMVELARGGDGRYGLAHGGDTFNTAVYLARRGVPVTYATELGDDPYSDGIVALARAEGVGVELIARRAGRMPGLYLIETTPDGERSFYYWRERAPARELFDGDGAAAVEAAMRDARLVYLSGITLSLYSAPALDRLGAAIDAARAAGCRVVMDGNYRPRGWGGDTARAKATLERFWRRADIALPTFDDEQLLWGDESPAATADRLAAHGVGEIVIKDGLNGAHALQAGRLTPIPVTENVKPVDTTAAGDSFNAAYLAARLSGQPMETAVRAGHHLAGIVIQHRGAIVPRAATQGA